MKAGSFCFKTFCMLFFLFFSTSIVQAENLDLDTLKKALYKYNTEENIESLGLQKNASGYIFLQMVVTRTLLKKQDTQVVLDALKKIHKDPHPFLKKVCLLDKKVICYSDIVSQKKTISLNNVDSLSIEDLLELLLGAFKTYTNALTQGDAGLSSKIKNNFVNWGKGGEALLKSYMGDYLADNFKIKTYLYELGKKETKSSKG